MLRFSTSYCFSFGKLYVSKYSSISSTLLIFWHIWFHNILLQFSVIPVVLIVIFTHRVVILFIQIFSLSLSFCYWVWLEVYKLYSFKEPATVLPDIYYCFVCFESLTYVLNFPFFWSIWFLFVVIYLVPLGVSLDFLFEVFLYSWWRSVLLYTSL